jgi:glycosyltransferase involved in cell wall biosynthesis
MNKVRVLHVAPSLNIGGVEVGLLRSFRDLQQYMDFRVWSVKGAGLLNVPSLTFAQALKLLFSRATRPQVIVTSLWLGHLVGGMFALICRARWVPFFHAARAEGFWRDMVLRTAARSSRFSFFDSRATFRYHGDSRMERSQIVPYRFQIPASLSMGGSERRYDCIYVGRIASPKRPDLLVEYLVQLQSLRVGLRSLIVISCNERDLATFKTLLRTRGVNAELQVNVDPMQALVLLGQSSLYLSFSDSEGFGMATVDAMSNGCVPVVRPVGEIASYVDENCGIVIDDISIAGIKSAAKKSIALLDNDELFRIYADRAFLRISSRYGLYIESYAEGVRRALNLR